MATVFSHSALLVMYFLYFYTEVQAQPMCSPAAEEGTDYTLYNTNRSRSVDGIVDWEVIFDGNSNTIYSHGFDYYDEFSAALDDPAQGIIIFNIRRDYATTYRCRVNGTIVFSCQLQVYKRPEDISCTEVKVHEDNTFTTKCTTAKVFPGAVCKLFIQPTMIDTAINYTHSQSVEDREYNSTTCAIQYNVTGMKAGNHTVTVAMFPDATGLSETLGANETSFSLTLSLPSLITTRCFEEDNVRDGFLLRGTTARCGCLLSDPGVPKGGIRWSYPARRQAFVTENTSVGFQFTRATIFTCEGISTLKGPYQNITKSLQIAYGPTSTEISHNATAHIDVCPSTDVYVRVQCTVDRSDVQPEPTFELSSPPQSKFRRVHDYLDSATSEKYTQVYIVQPLIGGSHTLTCMVRNSKFGNVSATNFTSLEARAPPSAAPNLDVKGSQPNGLLVEKDDVTMTCVVTGGFPLVQSVTITCEGREPITASGTSVTLTWSDISIIDNGTQCVCTASHVTQCYDITTTVRLLVVADSSSSSSSDLGLGLGVGLCIAVIIVIILVIVFVIFKRRGWNFKQFTVCGRERPQQRDQPGRETRQGQQQQQPQQQQPQQQKILSKSVYDEINMGDRDSGVDIQSSAPHDYTDFVVESQCGRELMDSIYENVPEGMSPTSQQETSTEKVQHTGEQQDKLGQTPSDQESSQQGQLDKDMEECPYIISDVQLQVNKRKDYINVPGPSPKENIYVNFPKRGPKESCVYVPRASIKEKNANEPKTVTEGSYVNMQIPGIKDNCDTKPGTSITGKSVPGTDTEELYENMTVADIKDKYDNMPGTSIRGKNVYVGLPGKKISGTYENVSGPGIKYNDDNMPGTSIKGKNVYIGLPGKKISGSYENVSGPGIKSNYVDVCLTNSKGK